MGDLVFGDRSGSRSRAFFGAIGSDVQPDEDRANGEERDGAGGVCQSTRGKKQTVGRGVLGEGVFRQYRWPAWKRKGHRRICEEARRGKGLSSIAQRPDGLRILNEMPRS